MANTSYLDKDDYTICISIENLEDIIDQGIEASGVTEQELLDNSELTAQAEIRSYLNSIYKIDEEFAIDFDDAPDVRNKLVLRCTVNCSLYNLHMTISPRDVPEKIEKAYEHCMESLDAARRGELDFGLPPQEANGTDPTEWRKAGSNLKFVSKEYHNAGTLDSTWLNNPNP
jgi:hypothetical protein